MKKVLDVKDLCVTYSNKERSVYAVQNVSFSLNEGDSIGIVGESGSGKSTLVMALLRLLSEQTAKVSGECYLNGKELLSLPPEPLRKMRWTEMAIVFQKAMNALSPVHRICTQIEDIYREHAPKATRQQIKDRTMELFRMVGLPERVYRLYPHEVSGGMLQRVAIVISLLHQPKLLVFDEATTALDVVTQGQILEEIVRLEKNLNMTRIMITHDMSVVAASCKKVAVMYAGQMLEIGFTESVLKHPMHPYTQGLLQSFPTLYGPRQELRSIPGNLPDLSVKLKGCVFASRCPYADGRCRDERPQMHDYAPGCAAACWHCGGDAR